jgi:hypothetical protein
MKKSITLSILIFITFCGFAKKVRFRVDMSGQTISSNGVRIAGNFQALAGYGSDWSPSATPMSNGGSGSIYSVTVDVPSGRFYEYKFINGNDWPGSENVPALVQVGHPVNGGSNNNRWSFVDSTSADTLILPAVLFGGVAPVNKYAVRFSVDLNGLTIANDGVLIAGSFTSWGSGQRRMANLFTGNKLYEFIAILDINFSYEYKFKNGDTGWESIPSSCATNGNRLVLANSNKAEPRVCFNSCTFCPTAPISRFNALFRVDMTSSTCFGGFDSVTVAGNRDELTNWSNGVKLVRLGTTNIYQALIQLDSGQLDFKFRFHKNGSTDWENGSNRLWTLSRADTLPITCFGSQNPGTCTPQPAPSTITFRVDLSNVTPNPQGKIYVMGNFQSPSWQAGAIRMNPVQGAPGIYSATVNNVCPATFNYVFLNGDSSLATSPETFPDTSSRSCLVSNGVGGFNRTYTRISANPVTLGFIYNRCQNICGTFATVTPVGSASVCQGNTVLLNANSGSGFSYQWINANGAIPNATSSSFTVNTSGAYRAVITNIKGCVDTSASVNVSINPLPTATATAASATTFCLSGSVAINANTGTGLTYQWRNASGNITGATNASYTANATGAYKVVVTNSNGCVDSSSAVSVTVNSLPTATATAATATTFCQGGNVLINANTGTGLTYQWRNASGNITGATNATYTANTTGAYKVVVTNSNGCVDSSTAVSVTVNPLPTATATAATATTFCQGGSVAINANTGIGLIYQWRNANGNITGATNASYTANATGAYRVVVTNTNNCSDTSLPIQVTAHPRPTPGSIAGDTSNLNTNIPYVYTITPQTNHTYNWVVTNGNITAGQSTNSITVQWISNGKGNIKVTLSNPFNCTDSAVREVSIGSVGLSRNMESNSLRIYPNPASDRLTINLENYSSNSEFSIRIINALGQQVYHKVLSQAKSEIDLTTCGGDGILILHLLDKSGQVVDERRIIIRQ